MLKINKKKKRTQNITELNYIIKKYDSFLNVWLVYTHAGFILESDRIKRNKKQKAELLAYSVINARKECNRLNKLTGKNIHKVEQRIKKIKLTCNRV